ncbi:MAG: hypothetical protein KAG61_03695 [Bacteriovoracaceae bacterium]|nr:hypothetical protein [Bacteriovoracaceae bacterium]
MKLITTLILLIMSINTFAIQVNTGWTKNFKKILSVNCSEDDGHLCANLCENYSSCEVEESYCRNCAGDNLFIKYLFKELGNRIQNGGDAVPADTFLEFIKEGNFTSLTSKSIYNFIDRYNSFATKEKFRSLCPNPTEYPIVFLGVNEVSRSPESIRYVACSNSEQSAEIFNLKKIYDVEVN